MRQVSILPDRLTMAQAAGLVVASVLVAGVACKHAAKTPSSCTVNGDCAAGKVCLSGVCQAPFVCETNADCTSGDVCQSGACMPQSGCASDTDCASSPASPWCDTGAGACVACLTDAECADGGMCVSDICMAPAMQGCTSDSDCTAVAALSHCLVSDGRCVACLNNADCASDGGDAVCDMQIFACQQVSSLCQTDGDCASTPATPHCRPGDGVCVACTTDSECTVSGQRCLSNDTCAPMGVCGADVDCAAPTPRCDVATSTCVVCVGNTDCPVTEICGYNNLCHTFACQHNADCTGGQVCVADVDPQDPTKFLNQCETPSNPGGVRAGKPCSTNASTCFAGQCIGDLPTYSGGTGNGYCQGGCASDADCPARSDGVPGACEAVPMSWTDMNGVMQTTTVNSCVVQCASEIECLANTGEACLLVPDVGGSTWATRCDMSAGMAGVSGGSPCTDDSQCETNMCIKPGISGTGLCMAVCGGSTPSENCSPVFSSICPAEGVYVPLPNGTKAVAHICWGPTCTSATTCPLPVWACEADPEPGDPGQTVSYCQPL